MTPEEQIAADKLVADAAAAQVIADAKAIEDAKAPTTPKFPANTPVADMAPAEQTEYWKFQSRKHEANFKAVDLSKDEIEALRVRAAKADELENNQKTEAQKNADRATKAENDLKEERSKRLRAEVAAEKGITGDMLEFLTGKNKEELETSADKLLAFRGPGKKVDTGAGDRGSGVGGEVDYDAQIAVAQKAGNLQQVIALRQAKAAAAASKK